ncbi:hypothetical protein AAMO2058_001604400 [Amorphochlora amoebiformis]
MERRLTERILHRAGYRLYGIELLRELADRHEPDIRIMMLFQLLIFTAHRTHHLAS